MNNLIFNRVHSLYSFIKDMQHLSISQWEVEQKELPVSSSLLAKRINTK